MITEVKNITMDGVVISGHATITRPESILFAYNPFWLDVSVDTDVDKFIVEVRSTPYGEAEKTYTIEGALYARHCRLYLSRIFQLFFNNPLAERGKTISLALKIPLNPEGTILVQVATYDFYVIWGSIRLGERLQSFGVFKFDRRKPYFERHRVWFKKFPFKVTMFAFDAAETLRMVARYDNLRYDEYNHTTAMSNGIVDIDPAEHFPLANTIGVFKQPGVTVGPNAQGVLPYSTFTSVFDYTFQVPQEFAVITRLPICNDTDGYYLRWIDSFGCLEYFLFTKGSISEKYKPSSDTKEVDGYINGMLFGNIERNLSTTSDISCKCCASLLPDEIYEYVRTIIRSPYVDLYMGKTKAGEEIWCPVKIEAGSLEYERRPNLHDIEITFQMPSYNSPTL